jgi:hypothetical protein
MTSEDWRFNLTQDAVGDATPDLTDARLADIRRRDNDAEFEGRNTAAEMDRHQLLAELDRLKRVAVTPQVAYVDPWARSADL